MIIIRNDSLRKILSIIIPFILIPALAIAGVTLLDEKKHLLVSLAVAVLSLIVFITGFEKKITGTRRMVIVAVMIAICVVGRAIPFFKPVTAVIIIAAVYLGGESGFMIGAFSALLSNFYFGQGPWTPFQMLGWGLVGLVAGYLSLPLKKSRVALLIYGAISGVLFSVIMDIWTVLGLGEGFEGSLYLSALTTATAHAILYSISNVIFLLLLAKPIGDKLNRIKIKYGI
jgi:energy-coupling factor transport system substrate-specific component